MVEQASRSTAIPKAAPGDGRPSPGPLQPIRPPAVLSRQTTCHLHTRADSFANPRARKRLQKRFRARGDGAASGSPAAAPAGGRSRPRARVREGTGRPGTRGIPGASLFRLSRSGVRRRHGMGGGGAARSVSSLSGRRGPHTVRERACMGGSLGVRTIRRARKRLSGDSGRTADEPPGRGAPPRQRRACTTRRARRRTARPVRIEPEPARDTRTVPLPATSTRGPAGAARGSAPAIQHAEAVTGAHTVPSRPHPPRTARAHRNCPHHTRYRVTCQAAAQKKCPKISLNRFSPSF